MLNIRRIDHEDSGTHCWRVTVQRRTRVYVRNFSDGQHGGTQKALEAAQVYRDRPVQAHLPFPHSRIAPFSRRAIDQGCRSDPCGSSRTH